MFAGVIAALLLAQAPPRYPAGTYVPESEGFTLYTSSFQFPVHMAPDDLRKAAEVRLHVSRDSGKSWKLAATVKPDQGFVNYTAPQDGVYWFTIQVLDKNNDLDPPNLDMAYAMKVRVDTSPSGFATVVHEFSSRRFQVPIFCDSKRRSQIDSFRLFVSTDEGKTWQPTATAKPDEKHFHLIALRDDTFWFIVQAIDKNQKADPADLAAAKPCMKARVGTPSSSIQRVSCREIHLPSSLFPAASFDVVKLRLYVSEDDGKTWKKEATATPDQIEFTFTAPRDGKYCFIVQQIGKDGEKDPPDFSSATAHHVVQVGCATRAGIVTVDELCKAASLPSRSFVGGYMFTSAGWSDAFQWRQSAAEIAALKKRLSGDARDADLYYQLGHWYSLAQQTDFAKNAYLKAVELYRLQLKQQPDSNRALTGLAAALMKSEQGQDQAESILRQAVKKIPAESPCWQALGSCLLDRSWNELNGDTWKLNNFRAGSAAPATSAQISRVQKWLDEAAQCAEKAVALAPKDADAYKLRAQCRFGRALISALIRLQQGDKVNAHVEANKALFSPESLADFRQAGTLEPDEPRTIFLATMAEVAVTLLNQKPAKKDEKSREKLPAELLKSVDQSIRRLNVLTSNENKGRAALAWEVAGLLQTVIRWDPLAAVDSLRKAVELDPTREQAWELLTNLLFDQPEDCRAVCLKRLRHTDSAHNRIALARLYESQDQLDQAEEEVRAALKLEPEDPEANIALAVLLIKRSTDENSLEKVRDQLNKACELLRRVAPGAFSTEYDLNWCIYMALSGEVEQSIKALQDLVRYDPTNQRARNILTLLAKDVPPGD